MNLTQNECILFEKMHIIQHDIRIRLNNIWVLIIWNAFCFGFHGIQHKMSMKKLWLPSCPRTKEGSRGQKTRLECSLGFAFNLNDYPGAIKLYLNLIYFFIHLFNLFCEKTITNCICTGWIANNNIIIHDS